MVSPYTKNNHQVLINDLKNFNGSEKDLAEILFEKILTKELSPESASEIAAHFLSSPNKQIPSNSK